jgi:amidase
VRGPLHGIPIAVKDNIQTMDMPTTAGTLAFKGFVPSFDATLVRNLRNAGAVIVAKTTMTELANWMASHMPNNYNAIVGFGLNPYDPRRDPRHPDDAAPPALDTGGSSSGAGTAASFWAANVGTETSGSILSPANQNMLVGIKPTVGRISRYGVIPITSDQDTPGPMARTVMDAAILFGVLEGATDPFDPATTRCPRIPNGDYTRFLDARALDGARIGVPRALFYSELDADSATLMEDALRVLKQQGATVVDPAELPSVVASNPQNDYRRWPVCAGVETAKTRDGDCSIVLKYGMKRDFNAWLTMLGPAAPVASLTALRQWNLEHAAAGSLRFGQAQLDNSDEMDVAADRKRYEADRAKDMRLATTEGIDAAMTRDRLDALLFPSIAGYDIAARAGYPSVIVPFGFVPHTAEPPFPAGFNARPSPFGVTFTAMACSEPRLIAIAYAFEQATRRRVPPHQFP